MPKVDAEKCIHCGLCDKVCIIGKSSGDVVSGHTARPTCFYGWAKDDRVRKRSASGGLAHALSEMCIKEGGVVFGVVGKYFEDVHHVKAVRSDDLPPLCGSKYVQSRVGMAYAEAKAELEKGKDVLFTGTPCQIAALYSYLGKDYENLLTGDCICHSVPSQKVLKANIEILEREYHKKVISFGRDESFQYSPPQYVAWFEDGSHEILSMEKTPFRAAFLTLLIARKSCAGCPFAALPRTADISWGDMFFSAGIDRAEADPDNIGLSLFTVNSEKGEKAIGKICERFECHPFDLDIACQQNGYLAHCPEGNPLRDEFFDVFLNGGLQAAEKIIRRSSNDVSAGKRLLHRISYLWHPIKACRKMKEKVYMRKDR